MNWYLVDANNVVQNRIVYDGVSAYTPDVGLTLKSSATMYKMGDTFNG